MGNSALTTACMDHRTVSLDQPPTWLTVQHAHLMEPPRPHMVNPAEDSSVTAPKDSSGAMMPMTVSTLTSVLPTSTHALVMLVLSVSMPVVTSTAPARPVSTVMLSHRNSYRLMEPPILHQQTAPTVSSATRQLPL